MDRAERRSFNSDERIKIMAKTNNRCAHCGRKINLSNMTVEHIYPIHKGGKHEEFNLVALCNKCNEEKSNYTYSIYDYYGYIYMEYAEEYENNLLKYMLLSDDKSLIKLDYLRTEYIPEKITILAQNMYRRGNKQKNILNMVNNNKINVSIGKAYEGDGDEIVKLMQETGAKSKYYDNVYKVYNAIKDDEVYVFREEKSQKILGFSIFKKLNEEYISNVPQLNNIAEVTTYEPTHIHMLTVIGKMRGELELAQLYHNIGTKVSDHFTLHKSICINFYEDKSRIKDTNPDIYIIMPYSIDGIDGYIRFDSIKKLRMDYARSILKKTYAKITNDKLEEVINTAFYRNGMSRDEAIIKENDVRQELLEIGQSKVDFNDEEFLKTLAGREVVINNGYGRQYHTYLLKNELEELDKLEEMEEQG